jgi:hypothetical protein
VTDPAPAPKPAVDMAAIEAKALALAQQPGGGVVLGEVEEEASEVQQSLAKSGFKSSEFWITLLVALVGTAIPAVQLWQGKLDMAGAGAFLGGVLQALHYTKARTDLKTAHVDAAS